MAYDEETAERVRNKLFFRQEIEEKKMFGGVGFFLHGNMCVGVWKEFLIVRVGKPGYEAALAESFTREFDITGRAMQGWVMVEPEGFAHDDNFCQWIDKAVQFVSTLPAQ